MDLDATEAAVRAARPGPIPGITVGLAHRWPTLLAAGLWALSLGGAGSDEAVSPTGEGRGVSEIDRIVAHIASARAGDIR
jgi:hypothetical protein